MTHRRQEVWDRLTDISVERDEPWFIVGDLNEILDNSEKLGGPAREEASFFPFRNMLHDCRLREIPHTGNKFSWGGIRNNMWIQIRLDRALGNAMWFQLFPRVQSEYLERIGSDHRPVLTRLVNENQSHSGRFMFDKRWVNKPETVEIVRQGWLRNEENGNVSLLDRIASCRKSLAHWKRSTPSNSKMKIRFLRENIEAEGSKLNPNLQLMRVWKGELADAYREEEIYWKEKSKEDWLCDGDRNTKFFHGSVQRRRAQNKVPSLVDEDGREHFSEGSKGDIAVNYFQKLFTSSRPADANSLLQGLESRVTPDMNEKLIQPVTSEEIRKAVFSIRSSSASGADGMTGLFFQSYWNVVGQHVTSEIKRFFELGTFPSEWNLTQLCLLPKKTNPNNMTDLRPISLCAVAYKIISKILCSRLKNILPQIISEAQGAFVPGRLISDNILLAHEMVHALKTNPDFDEDYMAIKTDMSKAYDRVEWDFLEKLCLKLGFDGKWVQWIMVCVRSVTYSVLLNGNSYGFITPTRGIRQGDPLSPFLFILCAEGLVHTMTKAETEGRITGLKLTRNCPSIQHLLFADDSLFICKANFKEGEAILQCLKNYGEASGQEINFKKSAITYGKKMDPIMKHLLGLYMGIHKEGGDGKYLGLPECFSGSKRELLAYITDRLKGRLSGWYAKTLSLGGKEILLKSVAMALPVFAMSCFKLTQHQCQKLTSAMTSFWWNANEEHNKMHWVSWDKMCKSKKDGGLGFRDVSDFNQSLLAKQAWRLLSAPSSLLARVYKARYYHNTNFLLAPIGYRPSYAWRSILHGRQLLEKGLMKTIGDGKDTRVWLDNWIFDDDPRRPYNLQTHFDLNLKVSNLITSQGSWNQHLLSNLFSPQDVIRIMSFPPNIAAKDSYIWAYNYNGVYSVKSGSWLLAELKKKGMTLVNQQQGTEALKSKVWDIKTLPKIKMFLWRALSGALAVADCLRKHGLNTPSLCSVCHMMPETICHVLFKCEIAAKVWEIANIPRRSQGFSDSLEDNFSYVFHLMKKNGVSQNLQMAIPWILWGIWKHRNELIYADKLGDLETLVTNALTESGIWHNLMAASHSTVLQSNQVPRVTNCWLRPPQGFFKCNINAAWLNASHMCGGAWILRNHQGEAVFHARETFLPAFNRIAAELRCIIWVLNSLSDIHIDNVELWSDSAAAIEAVIDSSNWPRYHSLTTRIHNILPGFQRISFRFSSNKANRVARAIAKSVTNEGRFQSYIARGGPAWLHSLIEEDNSGR